jgi:glycosyltransferase involved in cell wall biosynthesis
MVALNPSWSGSERVSSRGGLRILWLTTTADTDGPGRALLALLNHWRPGDTLAVCALRSVSESFKQECDADVEFHDLAMRGPWDLAAIARLIRLCRAWHPDLVHTQLSRADWIGRPIARVLGLPVLSTIHNVHSRMYDAEFGSVAARMGLALDRWTAPLARRLVAVSHGVRRDLEAHGVAADRIAVIHNGLDGNRRRHLAERDAVRRAWNVAPDDVVVGTVALLKEQKGIRFLVDAARMVIARNPSVRFVHMGDGPLQRDISRRIAVAGLGERFQLLDRVPDPVQWLSGLDVFALPSLWEGLPIALLEAMTAGLPSVGTAVSGIEEVVEDGRTGRLVPAADPAALAEAILALASDPATRARYGAAAAQRVHRFDPALAAASYRQLYVHVLRPQATAVRLESSVPQDVNR